MNLIDKIKHIFQNFNRWTGQIFYENKWFEIKSWPVSEEMKSMMKSEKSEIMLMRENKKLICDLILNTTRELRQTAADRKQ